MRQNRMQRGHSPKHRPSNRETNPLQQKRPLIPCPLRKARILHIRLQHITPSRPQTQRMPALIQRQIQVHPEEGGCPDETRGPENSVQGGMQGCGGGEGVVESREDHEDHEVDGEEVRFPEEVEEGEMAGAQEETAGV